LRILAKGKLLEILICGEELLLDMLPQVDVEITGLYRMWLLILV
jgi:hypothetical protein